jgi:hypothetical protein
VGNGASVANSNTRLAVAKEYERVKRDSSRDHLFLDEMVQLRSLDHLPVDFMDLGALFCLDGNLDGKVTLDELHEFVALCMAVSKGFQAHEAQQRLSAFFLARMWEGVIQTSDDEAILGADFVNWITVLLSQCSDNDLLSGSLDLSASAESMEQVVQRRANGLCAPLYIGLDATKLL